MKNFAHNSGQYLQVDGAKIYYEISGKQDSPALLFLHGGFGNIEDFNAILPDLDKEFQIIGIDSRGESVSVVGIQQDPDCSVS